MWRFLRSFLLVGVLAFSFSGVAGAQSWNDHLKETGTGANYDTSGRTTVYSMVETGITAFLGILAFIFFGLVTYAGVEWMTARGNDEKVARAKGIIEGAIIGLVVVMSAYAITTFVFKSLSS